MSERPTLILPDWPAPSTVGAFVTTRESGPSQGAFASFNPADHVGDDPVTVAACRRRLSAELDDDRPLLWLEQVHGANVQQEYRADFAEQAPRADASVAFDTGHACVVLTADCLPVFFCDRQGTRVGVAHAGWRSLAGGVLEASVAALGVAPDDLMAWLGPAISRRSSRWGPRCSIRSWPCSRKRKAPSSPVPIGSAITWRTSIAWRGCVSNVWASAISAGGTSVPPANRASIPTAATTATPVAWPA